MQQRDSRRDFLTEVAGMMKDTNSKPLIVIGAMPDGALEAHAETHDEDLIITTLLYAVGSIIESKESREGLPDGLSTVHRLVDEAYDIMQDRLEDPSCESPDWGSPSDN